MDFYRFNFRYKLLIFFIFLSIFPLVLVTIFVYQKVQSTYQKTLEESFTRNAQIRQQILVYFLESNRSWIRSLASQDLLLEAIGGQSSPGSVQTSEEPLGKSSPGKDKVFASLNSIRRENVFIDRAYIADPQGKVIISTATNDEGAKIGNLPSLTVPLKERTTYIDKVTASPYKKRVIPLSTPLVRKSDNVPIGVLIIELDSSIIKALFEGMLYPQAKQQILNESGIEAYVVDNDGYPLTALTHQFSQEKIRILPVNTCLDSGKGLTGTWTSYFNQQVFGASECVKLDGLTWTLIVEQPTKDVFLVSRQLGLTILLITIVVGVLLFLIVLPLSRSITDPIKKLSEGAQILGSGNLDYRIAIKTGDELEGLAQSFNEMAAKLKGFIYDIDMEKEVLEVQKSRLNQNAKLLLRRDLELRGVNDELELEKDSAEAERNKFQMVLGGIADGVLAVNLERKIITLNSAAEKITGWRSWEIINKNIDEVVKLFDKEEEISASEYCPIKADNFEGVVFSKTNLKMVGASDKVAFVNLTSGKIKEGASIKLGCIITFHDITEEQQLERMKLDFVSMAAHELRTPLTTVQGYVSLLQEEETLKKLNEQEKEFLTRVSVSSSTLNKLIENLLVVSRIEQGKLKIDTQPLQLELLVKKMVKEFDGLAKTKGLEISANLPETLLPPVLADPIRVEEVLSNLIGNAINYTQKGRIQISLRKDNNFVVTKVADTGQGIPVEALSHLFTKFFRVKGDLEAGSKGTGLGLYISKNIIETHHGKIWVESKLNVGSTFSFSLPIAPV